MNEPRQAYVTSPGEPSKIERWHKIAAHVWNYLALESPEEVEQWFCAVLPVLFSLTVHESAPRVGYSLVRMPNVPPEQVMADLGAWFSALPLSAEAATVSLCEYRSLVDGKGCTLAPGHGGAHAIDCNRVASPGQGAAGSADEDWATVMRAMSLIVTMPNENPPREFTNVPVRDLKAFARVVTAQQEEIVKLESHHRRPRDE